jgi:hypothetical protein
MENGEMVNRVFRQHHDLMRAKAEPGSPREPFPGERERDTLTTTEKGSVGGTGFGADLPSVNPHATLDEQTAHEHEIEGGGAASQRDSDKSEVRNRG